MMAGEFNLSMPRTIITLTLSSLMPSEIELPLSGGHEPEAQNQLSSMPFQTGNSR